MSCKPCVEEMYALYRRNLPYILRDENTVREILGDADNHIISCRDGDGLSAVSVINGNVIYLLCVDKPYRRRGLGTKLLARSETWIASKGFDKAVAGAGKDYIMPGVPMKENAHLFFKKNGYIHSWGSCGCYDMSLPLNEFCYDEHSIGDVIDGVEYRWAVHSDLDNVLKCVADAEESFVPYYAEKEIYGENADSKVLVALIGDEAVGALHVDIEHEEIGAGSIGCTVTMNKHQGKGIATTMVKLGTKHLKESGLKKATLGYTYTDIVHMYGRAGYKISMEYYMAEKTFLY